MLKHIGAAMGAALLITAAGASPALATTTGTEHSSQISDVIPVTCDGPGATSYAGIGNSVQHFTVNNNGDWFTTTREGQVTLTTLWHGAWGTWTGHLQEWFGSEDNKQSNVQHATVNFNGTSTADPSATLTIHGAFTQTTNANGVLVVNNMTFDCR
ncbi:hypothetical protein [Sinomonas sp. G460-2]|uniref:hypothetical protein n=1 Tax=Sinomonas sp. G460-2 TaxID=3393464 RepID=UPI0039EE5516